MCLVQIKNASLKTNKSLSEFVTFAWLPLPLCLLDLMIQNSKIDKKIVFSSLKMWANCVYKRKMCHGIPNSG